MHTCDLSSPIFAFVQLSTNQPLGRVTDRVRPCNARRVVVDLKRLRAALKDLRIRAGYKEVAALAKASGIDKSTIYRLEDTNQKPDLLTVATWVDKCGLTLSAFFAELETDIKKSLRSELETAHNPDAERLSPGVANVEALAVSPPADLRAAAQVLETLQFAITESLAIIQGLEQRRATDVRERASDTGTPMPRPRPRGQETGPADPEE